MEVFKLHTRRVTWHVARGVPSEKALRTSNIRRFDLTRDSKKTARAAVPRVVAFYRRRLGSGSSAGPKRRRRFRSKRDLGALATSSRVRSKTCLAASSSTTHIPGTIEQRHYSSPWVLPNGT